MLVLKVVSVSAAARISLCRSLSLSIYIYIYTSNTTFLVSPAGLLRAPKQAMMSDARKKSALSFSHRNHTERCSQKERTLLYSSSRITAVCNHVFA